MTRDEFRQYVDEALATIPPKFRQALQNIAIVVEDEPSADVLAEVGIEPPDTLLGLYQGTPLTERDGFYSALPDRVLIFRGPILRACQTRREVIREVRETVQHELGHYFGLEEHELPF